MAFISALEVYSVVGQGRKNGMHPILLEHGITHAHFGYKPPKKLVLYILPCAPPASSREREKQSLWQAKQLPTSVNYLELFLKYKLEHQLGDIS